MNYLLHISILLFLLSYPDRAAIIPVEFGNYIFDFNTYGENYTTIMANRWESSREFAIGQPKVIKCTSGDIFFGGRNILKAGDSIQRTYTFLAAHQIMTYSIFLGIFDNWLPSDILQVEVDGNVVLSLKPQQLQKGPGDSKCDAYAIAHLVGRVAHSNPNVTFKITSTVNTAAHYGIRDLTALFDQANGAEVFNSYVKVGTSTSSIQNASICSTNMYPGPSGVCLSCNSNCFKCLGSSASDCYSCHLLHTYNPNTNRCESCPSNCITCYNSSKCAVCNHENGYTLHNGTCLLTCPAGYIEDQAQARFCRLPCANPSHYMLVNGSCVDSCPAPLLNRTFNNIANFCDSPCGEASIEYYYWNKSCKSTCPFLAQNVNGANFCHVCPLLSEYVYPNGECRVGCPSPYKSIIFQFCNYPCQAGEFYFWNGSCLPTCSSPYFNQTLDFSYCRTPCQQSSQFMLPNGTCINSCKDPYIPRFELQAKFCDYPCQNGEFYFWNGSCLPACNLPNLIKTVDFDYCQTPCQQFDNYMLWNDLCSDFCQFPLVPRIESEAKFCDSPCGPGSSDFLYWNRSCEANCLFYPRNENGYKFCDACQPSFFMYPNMTCQPTCPLPYKNTTKGGSLFCNSPCVEDYFYYIAFGRCKLGCAYPYQIQDNFFCITKEDDDKTTKFTDISSNVVNILATSTSLLSFTNSAASFVEVFSEILSYIKYTQILFPPKLQHQFDVEVPPIFNIIPEIPDRISSQMPVKPLPYNFQRYDVHSSFLINFWQPFITLLGIFIIINVLILTSHWTRSCGPIRFISRKIKAGLKWNFFLAKFTSCFGQIVLYSYFELRTANPNNAFEILSLAICLFVNLLVVIVCGKTIIIVATQFNLGEQRSNVSSRSLTDEQNRIKKTREGFEVLLEGAKETSIIHQSFFCILVARTYLYVAIIAYLYKHSLLQMILISLLSMTMLAYLLKIRPLKNKLDLFQYALNEFLLLLAKLCFLTLSVFDALNLEEISIRDTLGEIIMKCNFVLNITTVLYSVFYFLKTLGQVYRSILAWLQKNTIQETNLVLSQSESVLDMDRDPRSFVQSRKDRIPKNSVISNLQPDSLIQTTIMDSETSIIHSKLADNSLKLIKNSNGIKPVFENDIIPQGAWKHRIRKNVDNGFGIFDDDKNVRIKAKKLRK